MISLDHTLNNEFLYRWDGALTWHHSRPGTSKTLCGRAIPVYAEQRPATTLPDAWPRCGNCARRRKRPA